MINTWCNQSFSVSVHFSAHGSPVKLKWSKCSIIISMWKWIWIWLGNAICECEMQKISRQSTIQMGQIKCVNCEMWTLPGPVPDGADKMCELWNVNCTWTCTWWGRKSVKYEMWTAPGPKASPSLGFPIPQAHLPAKITCFQKNTSTFYQQAHLPATSISFPKLKLLRSLFINKLLLHFAHN